MVGGDLLPSHGELRPAFRLTEIARSAALSIAAWIQRFYERP